jgi:hypothetical protein
VAAPVGLVDVATVPSGSRVMMACAAAALLALIRLPAPL